MKNYHLYFDAVFSLPSNKIHALPYSCSQANIGGIHNSKSRKGGHQFSWRRIARSSCIGSNDIEKHPSCRKKFLWSGLCSKSEICTCISSTRQAPLRRDLQNAQYCHNAHNKCNCKVSLMSRHCHEDKQTAYQKIIGHEGLEAPQTGCHIFARKSLLNRSRSSFINGSRRSSQLPASTCSDPKLARSLSSIDETNSAVQAAIVHCKRSLSVGSSNSLGLA